MIHPDAECTGCGACAAACSRNAITLRNNPDGFWYPAVDLQKCMKCNLCEEVCPLGGSQKEDLLGDTPRSFAVWNLNQAERQSSSSGGVFVALGKKAIERGGYVVGAAFDETFNVAHRIVHDAAGLAALQGSKYVQSSLSPQLLRQVQSLLQRGKSVLFSGTPCQIGGLAAFLAKPYANLLTAEVVCHGVPSPKAWRRYLDEINRRYADRPVSVSFRDKTDGWTNYSMQIQYPRQTYRKVFQYDSYGRAFVTDMFLRESCYHCWFKGKRRAADLSLSDFWGCGERFNPADEGTSLVLCNTEKGLNALRGLDLFLQEIPYGEAAAVNWAFLKSAPRYPKRAEAFLLLDRKPFGGIIRRFHWKWVIKRVLKRE